MSSFHRTAEYSDECRETTAFNTSSSPDTENQNWHWIVSHLIQAAVDFGNDDFFCRGTLVLLAFQLSCRMSTIASSEGVAETRLNKMSLFGIFDHNNSQEADQTTGTRSFVGTQAIIER